MCLPAMPKAYNIAARSIDATLVSAFPQHIYFKYSKCAAKIDIKSHNVEGIKSAVQAATKSQRNKKSSETPAGNTGTTIHST